MCFLSRTTVAPAQAGAYSASPDRLPRVMGARVRRWGAIDAALDVLKDID